MKTPIPLTCILIDQILRSLDVSPQTKKDYSYRLPLFFNFIQAHGFHCNTFLDYKNYLRTRSDLAVSSKNKYLVSSRVWLNELTRLGQIPDITKNVKTFRQTRRHKRLGIDEKELACITEHLKSLPSTVEAHRLKAIFSLLCLQGLREIEVCRLDVEHLDLNHKTMMIHGKARDDFEPVHLHPITVKTLTEYLSVTGRKSGPLLYSLSRNSKGKRLTTRGLALIMKTMLLSLGIDKCVHGYRNLFTTKLIKAYKGDLLEVMRYTRHLSVDTLQHYNDAIKNELDLPKFYDTFSGVSL